MTGIRRALLTAFLLPFLLYSTLAAGTMPVRGTDGVEIVICFGDTLATITVGPDGQPIDDRASAPVPCHWDHAAQPAVIAAAAVAPAVPDTLQPATYFAPARVGDIRARLRQVTNRGPPAAV